MSRRLRVLLTISDLRGGGAEREFALLAQHLSRQRFEPHLCFWRDIRAWQPPPDLPIHRVEKTRPWHVPHTLRQLRDLIDRLEPDLVFSQLHYVNMVTGTALARVRTSPRWICRQVNDPRREMRGPFAWWARRALARADRAVGCCEGVSRAMAEHLRLPAERMATLRNVVDLAQVERQAAGPPPLPPRPGAFTVVHAGRLVPQKNQALLIEALARMSQRRGAPDWELWMLGEGPEQAALRSLARRRGVDGRVRWLGFQPNPHAAFRAASCFALTSDHEGLPNVLIEAMACGAPALSTRCPYGPDELIEDGVSGRLVPVGEPEALADALLELARDPERARRLGAAGRERTLRDFDLARTVAAYEALFEAVTRGGAAPR